MSILLHRPSSVLSPGAYAPLGLPNAILIYKGVSGPSTRSPRLARAMSFPGQDLGTGYALPLPRWRHYSHAGKCPPAFPALPSALSLLLQLPSSDLSLQSPPHSLTSSTKRTATQPCSPSSAPNTKACIPTYQSHLCLHFYPVAREPHAPTAQAPGVLKRTPEILPLSPSHEVLHKASCGCCPAPLPPPPGGTTELTLWAAGFFFAMIPHSGSPHLNL